MALIHEIETASGIMLQEAYIKISDIDLAYPNKKMYIKIDVFLDKQSYEENKTPVFNESYVVDNANRKEAQPAVHAFTFEKIEKGSTATIAVYLKKHTVVDFRLKEGHEFEAGISQEKTIENLKDALNENSSFHELYDASTKETTLYVKAKPSMYGTQGNTFRLSGQHITSHMIDQKGQREESGLFDVYYGNNMTATSTGNLMSQSYEFLKSLERFNGAQNA